MANFKQFNEFITLPKTQDYLKAVLGEKKAQFVSNLTSLVANDDKLQVCEPTTVMYSAITATALDLPLNKNLGFAYVIPYKKKDGTSDAQFQLGYKGLVQLAIRSGQFQTMNVSEIREGELQDYDLLTGEIKFKAVPNRERAEIIGYVAYFRLTNGFQKMLYMTKEEMEAHGIRYSQTYGSNKDFVKTASKWSTDFDAMAKKTALKLLLSRYAPLSVEMQKAISADQAVIRTADLKPDYVDNPRRDDIPLAEEVTEEQFVTKILKAGDSEKIEEIISEMPDEMANSERVQQAIEKKKELIK